MDKIREYTKAIVAGIVASLALVIADVTDAVEANIEPVQIAVFGLINAVIVALSPANKQPTPEEG